MSYLVYCIFRGPLPADLETPTGVGGQRVFTVNHQGLDAVLSKLAEPDSPRDTSELLVYETVVESFYRHLTVIPMRYGCRVESPREAIGLLRKNHDAYGALLHEREGLGKMGVHVHLDTSGDGMESNARPDRAKPLPLDWDTGTAYPAAKRKRPANPCRVHRTDAFAEDLGRPRILYVSCKRRSDINWHLLKKEESKRQSKRRVWRRSRFTQG